MNRGVLITPYQQGAFSAYDELFNKFNPSVNVQRIFYSTMIQGGMHEFLISEEDTQKILLPKTNYKILSSKDFNNVSEVINGLFDFFMPEGYKADKQYSDVIKYQCFLVDIVLAMKMNKSIVWMSKSPDLNDIRDKIPPDLYFPLYNLISRLEQVSPELPLLSYSIPAKDVSIFYDLINTELFKNYAFSHSQLESNHGSVNDVIEAGNNFYRKYIESLELKKLSISLLSLTPKLVDSFFGKIPGHIADFFARLFTEQLAKDKKVVIYDFTPTINYLLEQYLFAKIKD
ncbi:hypothetical protein [Bacillus thuringiensis]|uniref:hypothetical protein n=1 Tax=Bacillus thuringiensis TaxID=1428 RepID=UPI000BFEA7C9|nr:hypothetical protein [Bacillus thuringiensis]PGY60316.1 hypothetical protein COE24_07560 [Bacillus thuringiensis]